MERWQCRVERRQEGRRPPPRRRRAQRDADMTASFDFSRFRAGMSLAGIEAELEEQARHGLLELVGADDPAGKLYRLTPAGEAAALAALQPSSSAPALIYPRELTPTLRWALGRMCFE